jgi:hypothetical protein
MGRMIKWSITLQGRARALERLGKDEKFMANLLVLELNCFVN